MDGDLIFFRRAVYYVYSYELFSMISKYHVEPKFFFLRLFSIIMLIASMISLIVTLFAIVNITVPDPYLSNDYYYGSYAKDTLRSGLSFFIVLFPVYLGTVAMLGSLYKKDRSLHKSLTPKWFTYGSIFLAGLVLSFSLVALVNRLLDGELTLRFGLKFLIMFAIAASVFGYHLWFVKREK